MTVMSGYCVPLKVMTTSRVFERSPSGLAYATWIGEVGDDRDPERALRAALQVRRTLSDREVRFAVHTGRGDQAVPVLEALVTVAPSGTILCSHGAYRHVRGVFDVREGPSLEREGGGEPRLTYFVERAKPRAFRIGHRRVV